MVELTEIKDDAEQLQQTHQEVEKKGMEDNYSSDEDAFEDDFKEDETLFERICALRDIVPPSYRSRIVNLYNTGANLVSSLTSKSGNVAWILTTSALLLGVPLSLSILSEQQLIEMEKTFDLQNSTGDMLTKADETAKA